MNRAAEARNWVCPLQPSLQGLELASAPLSIAELKPALRRLGRAAVADSSFLLVPLATTDIGGLRSAVEALRVCAKRIHICLVVDRETLECVHSRELADQGIGLALDEVDATTPLSAVVEGSLEAIRFDQAFVAGAAKDLRVEIILRAMVKIAHELGLKTLGPVIATGDWQPTASVAFDYVWRAPSNSPLDISRNETRQASMRQPRTPRTVNP